MMPYRRPASADFYEFKGREDETLDSPTHATWDDRPTVESRMNPPSEYMKQRYNEARQNLTKAVQFAYDNVTKPKDRQTLDQMLAYLKMKPGEASAEEIKFFDQQLAAFKKRGIIQDFLLLALRRRENVNQAMESAASASARVVSLRPTDAGTQLTEQLHVAGDALQEPDKKDKL